MDPEAYFWQLAAPRLAAGGVTRSTMMGLPCLRVHGQFFASLDRKTQHLLVKLPRSRVAALVAEGRGLPFAPAGRTFREWVAVPPAASESWNALLVEAQAFVGAHDTERQTPL